MLSAWQRQSCCPQAQGQCICCTAGACFITMQFVSVLASVICRPINVILAVTVRYACCHFYIVSASAALQKAVLWTASSQSSGLVVYWVLEVFGARCPGSYNYDVARLLIMSYDRTRVFCCLINVQCQWCFQCLCRPPMSQIVVQSCTFCMPSVARRQQKQHLVALNDRQNDHVTLLLTVLAFEYANQQYQLSE